MTWLLPHHPVWLRLAPVVDQVKPAKLASSVPEPYPTLRRQYRVELVRSTAPGELETSQTCLAVTNLGSSKLPRARIKSLMMYHRTHVAVAEPGTTAVDLNSGSIDTRAGRPGVVLPSVCVAKESWYRSRGTVPSTTDLAS
jgi:hypothetical protein